MFCNLIQWKGQTKVGNFYINILIFLDAEIEVMFEKIYRKMSRYPD